MNVTNLGPTCQSSTNPPIHHQSTNHKSQIYQNWIVTNWRFIGTHCRISRQSIANPRPSRILTGNKCAMGTDRSVSSEHDSDNKFRGHSSVNPVTTQCKSIVSLTPIQFQSRVSCANPMSILDQYDVNPDKKCSCPASSHQANANRAPIECLSNPSIRCQSGFSQLPIQWQSNVNPANPMPICCQSKAARLWHQSIASPDSFNRQHFHMLGNRNTMPIQCQSNVNHTPIGDHPVD